MSREAQLPRGDGLAWVEVYRGEQASCLERAFVLEAVGVPFRLAGGGAQSVLLVPSERATIAAAELSSFASENRAQPRVEGTPAAAVDGVVASFVYGLVLAVFFALQQHQALGLDWSRAGRADAEAIRSGDWWRALTALTLHVDLAHLAANMFFGGFFGAFVSQAFGSGAAWLSVLVAGGLGNGLNAALQPPPHAAVGASTAVFGSIGILSTYYWRVRHRQGQQAWRRWAPLIVGTILLAWLGASGERTDVLGHVCGLLAGFLLGLLHGALGKALRPQSARLQRSCALVAMLLLALAWFEAARH
ncbi:MAG: rhomboid family intramembrane serine protease [Planctomycetota bacterium]